MIVQALLGQGVDMNQVDNYGYTALSSAAWEGHLPTVQYLVEQGADTEKADNNGNGVPLLTASTNGHLNVVRYLLEQVMDRDRVVHLGGAALFRAACDGHLLVVQFLVEQGADVEKANNGGYTPLLTASAWGHLDVVRYLLEQGADRDKTYKGDTSLHCAVRNSRIEVAMLLMSYGADLNARNEDDQLPIDGARIEEMKQAIRDEPRRRMDHGHKRATEQDRHPTTAAATSASAQQDDEEEGEGEEGQSNKKPCLGEGAVTEEEAKILAEIDEDSEPSSDEEDD